MRCTAPYLWRLENFNRNRNALLAAPVPIPCLYLAQFLAISCVTLLTQLWVGVLFLICGLITGLQGFPPLDTIIWLLRGCVGGLAIAALQLFFSSFIRSFALPIAMALLGSVDGSLFSLAGFIFHFYSLMLLGMNSNKEEDVLAGSFLPFFLLRGFSCLIFRGADQDI